MVKSLWGYTVRETEQRMNSLGARLNLHPKSIQITSVPPSVWGWRKIHFEFQWLYVTYEGGGHLLW